jgi:uncharacterized protein
MKIVALKLSIIILLVMFANTGFTGNCDSFKDEREKTRCQFSDLTEASVRYDKNTAEIRELLKSNSVDSSEFAVRENAWGMSMRSACGPSNIECLAGKLSGRAAELSVFSEKMKVQLRAATQATEISLKSQSQSLNASVQNQNSSGVSTLQPGSFSPSFDCAKASTGQERLICDSRELSALDVKLSVTFRQALEAASDKNTLRDSQRNWRKFQRDSCFDVQCIARSYEARIADISAVQNQSGVSIGVAVNTVIPNLLIKDSTNTQAGNAEMSVAQIIPLTAPVLSVPIIAPTVYGLASESVRPAPVNMPNAPVSEQKPVDTSSLGQATAPVAEASFFEEVASSTSTMFKILLSILAPLLGIAIPFLLPHSRNLSNQSPTT